MKINNINYELAISLSNQNDAQKELITEIIVNSGINREKIVEQNNYIINKDSVILVYFSSQAKAVKLKDRLKRFNFDRVNIRVNKIYKKDWQNQWKKDFKPFKLTAQIEIIPLWYKKTYRPTLKKYLYIDTTMAFGTGLHATTRMIANFIERLSGQFNSCLDIGTGTGILAMIAMLSGAKDVSALDISSDAIKTARANFKENNIRDIKLRVKNIQNFSERKQYDLVVANLTTFDLTELSKKIIFYVRMNHYLAVSGISLNNYSDFKKHMTSLPLRCIKCEKKEGWVAVLYKRIENRRSS